MADNITIDAGSGGDTIAADDVGGVKIPRSKIIIGADGTNDGDVAETNPLPVKGQTITWAAPTFNSVGVATALALAANANRRGAIFVNDSANIIYLGIGAAAVIGSGIRLSVAGSAGDRYEMNLMNLSTQAVNAIAGGASSNMTVHEAT